MHEFVYHIVHRAFLQSRSMYLATMLPINARTIQLAHARPKTWSPSVLYTYKPQTAVQQNSRELHEQGPKKGMKVDNLHCNSTVQYCSSTWATVDREIFAVKNFLPAA